MPLSYHTKHFKRYNKYSFSFSLIHQIYMRVNNVLTGSDQIVPVTEIVTGSIYHCSAWVWVNEGISYDIERPKGCTQKCIAIIRMIPSTCGVYIFYRLCRR